MPVLERDAGFAHRERMARRSRKQTESVADIGPLPAVVNPERKEACRYNLRRFLETYFPQSTGLKPFSEDHGRVINRKQRCALTGGRFCNAVYRGFAKTTISENTSIWATFYGHRKFVPLFGGDETAGEGMIDSIKRELDGNDLLLEDFPEICYPIHCLEGKPQRQHSQTYQGALTHLRWTADKIVLPTIPGSDASGAILMARGLTGASRGIKHKRPDGTQQRPDLVIIDDPQTDESARSSLQTRSRLNIIKKSIIKSAGHNKSLAIVVNATVIEPDDMIDQLLDQKKNAAWQGERIKMVRQWSVAHETLWLKEYADLRTTYDKDDPESQKQAHEAATEFYRENRAAMDEGCEVSWEHCYDEENEISAIQHAYNMLIDDGPEVFASECQNEPLPPAGVSLLQTADEIARRVNGYKRRQVPQDAQFLTAFVDVQKDCLFWAVAAWSENFTGYIADYGAFPDQKRDRFTLREVRNTLSRKYPGAGLEGSLFAGLSDLLTELLDSTWLRDDGTRLAIDLCLVDANWGDSTETVYSVARQHAHSARIIPSHGVGIKATGRPLNDGKPKSGERRGLNWRVPPLERGKPVRHALYDTNFWKSFFHKRLATAIGNPGALTLFNAPPATHAMLAEHLIAETPETVQAAGRTVEEWFLRPHRPDNHLLDCLVGCLVGASMRGARLVAHREATTKRPSRGRKTRRKVSYMG